MFYFLQTPQQVRGDNLNKYHYLPATYLKTGINYNHCHKDVTKTSYTNAKFVALYNHNIVTRAYITQKNEWWGFMEDEKGFFGDGSFGEIAWGVAKIALWGALILGTAGAVLFFSDGARNALDKATGGLGKGLGSKLSSALFERPIVTPLTSLLDNPDEVSADEVANTTRIRGNVIPVPADYWTSKTITDPKRLSELASLSGKLQEAEKKPSDGLDEHSFALSKIDKLRLEARKFVANANAWDEQATTYQNSVDKLSNAGRDLTIPKFRLDEKVQTKLDAKKQTIPADLISYGESQIPGWEEMSITKRIFALSDVLEGTKKQDDDFRANTSHLGFEMGRIDNIGLPSRLADWSMFGFGSDIMWNTERDMKLKILDDLKHKNFGAASDRVAASIKMFDQRVVDGNVDNLEDGELQRETKALDSFLRIQEYVKAASQKEKLIPLLETTYSVVADVAKTAKGTMENYSNKIHTFQQEEKTEHRDARVENLVKSETDVTATQSGLKADNTPTVVKKEALGK
jgi:hypothetical protein